MPSRVPPALHQPHARQAAIFRRAAWARALCAWLLIILAESVHGTLREWFLTPALGEFRARQLSVLTGAAIIFLITWLCIRWIGIERAQSLLAVGGVWVGATVLFEIGLGRLLGYDWSRLLSDYDLRHGGLMGLGLVAMLFTPLAAARLRCRAPKPPAR